MDDRLHATHVSLYISLFTLWNLNRFENPISINREEVMKISKIGSKHTYHKCLKNLSEYGYLKYYPSHNPLRGSKVYMFNFSTTDEQVVSQTSAKIGTSNEQALPPSLNSLNNTNNKKSLNRHKPNSKKKNDLKIEDFIGDDKKMIPPENGEVISFFKAEKYPEKEAKKFFNYFQSVGWKVGKNKPMEDWHAAAHNWMLNTTQYNEKKNSNNFHTNPNKDYGEPL